MGNKFESVLAGGRLKVDDCVVPLRERCSFVSRFYFYPPVIS